MPSSPKTSVQALILRGIRLTVRIHFHSKTGFRFIS